MRRILADVNVVLDAVLDREPHSTAAAKVWMAAEMQRVEALLPAHGVTTLFYLVARGRGAPFARRIVGNVVATFGIATVDEAVIRRALALDWPDFEDAVCAAAAESAGCDAIVTRDPKGFPACAVPVLSAETAAALLAGGPPDVVAETQGPAYATGRGRRRARGRSAAATERQP